MKAEERLKQYDLARNIYNDIFYNLVAEADYEAFVESQYKKLEEKEKFMSVDEI